MASVDPHLCAYELERLERIASNQRRMDELSLVQQGQAISAPVRARGTKRAKGERGTSGRPPTRSTGGVRTPAEMAYAASKLCGSDELYSQRHVEALGTFRTPWDLYHEYVNGKRVYDRARGRTCHQCRQFTLGVRTSCNGCGLERRVMCGDCLWMRYGENCLETLANKSWLCPVCRDICNCSNSRCLRLSRGWPATGNLWKLVQDRWPSAAHYLVTTRQAMVPSAVGAAAGMVGEEAAAPVAEAAAAGEAAAAVAGEETAAAGVTSAAQEADSDGEATEVSDDEAPPVASPPAARALPFRAAKMEVAPVLRVGTVVRKRFAAGWFFGEVVAWDQASRLWSIAYDDGDSEEMSAAELQEVAVSGVAMEAARDKACIKLGKLAKRIRM